MQFDKILTKEFLIQEYKIKKRSKIDICRDINTTQTTLDKYLRIHNIKNNDRLGKKGKSVVGERFERLVVLSESEPDNFGKRQYLCLCDCGHKKVICSASLLRGLTKSCGCLKRELNFSGYKEISGNFWRRTVEGAIDRGMEFTITIEEAWNKFVEQGGKCALSGVELKFSTLNRKSFLQTASPDRIDSMLGYNKENFQWVHKTVNFMKGKLKDGEYISWCRLIADFTKDLPGEEIDFHRFFIKYRGLPNETFKENVSEGIF